MRAFKGCRITQLIKSCESLLNLLLNLPLNLPNGSEFAAHLDITAGLRVRGMPDVTVFFADSYCSWQKGAVEHENKLIRQYIPKKSNFNDFSDSYVRNVGKKLNLRPRRKLGFENPKDAFFKQIANFALAS